MDSIIKFATDHVELCVSLVIAFVICLTIVFKVCVTSNKNNITAGRDANVIKGIGNKIEKGSR